MSPWRGYAAAAVIYALTTGVVFLALPAVHEALFICYLPAIVLATLAGGGYGGFGVALGGGLAIAYWLYPVTDSRGALALMLYVDAAALLLYVMDLVNQTFEKLAGERDRAQLLFREAQHRTANNLMFVSGFLHRERREVQKDPSRAVACLDQAAQRLDTFSAVHRQLSAPGQSGQDIAVLFSRLCHSLIEAAGARHVTVSLEVEPVELSFEDTILLSLLLTEIVTNALKHAFNGQEAGQIVVLLGTAGDEHVLEVRDNGRGMAGSRGNSGSGGGAGTHILEMLAAQLGGALTWTNEGGLRVRVAFPRRAGNRALAPP